ncbi:DUF6924 domain-containing protein [Streptomyces sp. NPDC050523]|uniref:DUF6924 domain-containing protein n=1 Tax=Streptomyces sp. NPDC050523 TaxID=3365622 RepID=UPI0037914B98
MKANELTDAQLRALDGVRNDWLAHGLATGPADRAEAEAGVADAYRAADLEPPTLVIWLDSPLAGAVGARMLAGGQPPPQVEAEIRDRTRHHLETQVRDRTRSGISTEARDRIWAQVQDQVGKQVRDQVWGQIRDQARGRIGAHDENQVWTHIWDHVQSQNLWSQVRDPVRAQVRDQVGAEVPRSIPGQHGAELLAGWDYLRTHWSVEEADRLSGIMRVARSAGRWWPFENAVVLTERPTVLHRDDQGRLHCETGPAVAYPDGFAVWAWHGVRLPQDPVKTRPTIDRAGHDFETEALVVRTDYSDDAAWRAVVDLLDQPDVNGFDVRTHVVEDRAFAGASPEDVVLSTVAGEPGLEVVFLADATTMKGEHTLLAVSTRCEELDDEDDGDIVTVELGRQFRLLPPSVNLMHVNLAIGNQDFWEFAYEAAQDPANILRW